MDANKQTQAPGRPLARRLLLVAIFGLYLASVPWYRTEEPVPGLWLGLPSWVTVALLCYAGAAVLNGLAWLWTPIDDEAVVEIGSTDGDCRRDELL